MAFRLFRPLLAGAQPIERLIACVGATICLALVVVICARFPLTARDLPVIVAPLGASAVLVLAVPASPLAQPWPVIGGNVLSSLIGVAVFQAVPNMALAAGLAVGLAIGVMSLARCLHPPGGAAALTAVIGSQGIHAAGYEFALVPVGMNSIALVMLAMLFHPLTGRSYPHRPILTAPATKRAQEAAGLEDADIDAALAEMHESFDIDRQDLEILLSKARLHAMTRRGSPPR